MNSQSVKLWDVIDAEVRKIIMAGCAKTLAAESDVEDLADAFVDFCEIAVEPTEYSYPVYSIEASGLRIHPVSLPHALFGLAADGALIPWADLEGHTTNDVVKGIAQ